MQRITLTLDDETASEIKALAAVEMRHPREQALVLLRKALGATQERRVTAPAKQTK